MRVPVAFGGNPANPIPANAALLYKAAIAAAGPSLVAGGVPASLVAYLGSLQPGPTEVGTKLRVLQSNATFTDVAPTDLRDVNRLKPTIHNTIEAGYKGIIVTLDTWVPGWRPRDLSTSNFPQLRGRCLVNYTSDPVFRASLQQTPEENPQAAVLRWISVFGNPLTWEDLPWLRSLTKLPLIVKGICHPDDARRAKDGGVDGIYCSNHGGRQANGGIPAIDCLPGVVEAAEGLPVLFDSGIRSGADIVKALALGASAVGVGRPYAYGLAIVGEDGAVHVLRSLLAEADLIMAVDGYPTLKDLTPEVLRRVT